MKIVKLGPAPSNDKKGLGQLGFNDKKGVEGCACLNE